MTIYLIYTHDAKHTHTESCKQCCIKLVTLPLNNMPQQAELYKQKNELHVIQWNRYKATIELRCFSKRVVLHDSEDKHDIVKTAPRIWQMYVLKLDFPWTC